MKQKEKKIKVKNQFIGSPISDKNLSDIFGRIKFESKDNGKTWKTIK